MKREMSPRRVPAQAPTNDARAAARALGYDEDEVVGSAIEPDGSVLVTLRAANGDLTRVTHPRGEGQ